MSYQRKVYVVEGRRRGRLWRVQNCYWSRRLAHEALRLYRDGRNPRCEFRCVTYLPQKEVGK